jgi:hypothetical protein
MITSTNADTLLSLVGELASKQKVKWRVNGVISAISGTNFRDDTRRTESRMAGPKMVGTPVDASKGVQGVFVCISAA